MKEPEEDIGYEVGKWYMVEIAYQVYVPAKFIRLQMPCPKPYGLFSHNFPHPGKAIFENIEQTYSGCGFQGAAWDKEGYTSFAPSFRPVTENELWAVQAIETFQNMIAGRQKSFSIELPNGCRFVGKIMPPSKKANLPGEYWAEAIYPPTGEEKRGRFQYDGQNESVRAFLQKKFPGWHIIKLRQLKVSLQPSKRGKKKNGG